MNFSRRFEYKQTIPKSRWQTTLNSKKTQGFDAFYPLHQNPQWILWKSSIHPRTLRDAMANKIEYLFVSIDLQKIAQMIVVVERGGCNNGNDLSSISKAE